MTIKLSTVLLGEMISTFHLEGLRKKGYSYLLAV